MDKELYSSSMGTKVDATIDNRMFTKTGQKEIAEDFKKTVDAIDDINRFVKDKVGGYELTEAKKQQIEQTGIKESLIQALEEKGVSQEKIQEVLSSEKVMLMLAGVQQPTDTESDITNNKTRQIDENSYYLGAIETTGSKDLQDYLVDSAGAMNEIVKIVGEDNAAGAILVTQFALQGTVKTVTAMLGDEAKETIFGGAKDKLGDYIANEYFDIEKGGWSTTQKESINTLSDASSGFAVDTLISGGAFGIIKSAEKLGSASDGFDATIGSGTVTNQGVYDSKDIRSSLENTHGAENVTSTTIPKQTPRQTVNSKENVEVITDANGNKAVITTYKDPLTGEITKANIPYNDRGLPVFDDVSKFTTSINNDVGYTTQMKHATIDLKNYLDANPAQKSNFTDKQLEKIEAGSSKIPGYTWHHNADSNNMQLVPKEVHDSTLHIGQAKMKDGN